MEIVRQLTGLSVSHVRQFRDDDSYIDRLNHRYTTALCVVFAILVTTKQYAGKSIDIRHEIFIMFSYAYLRRSHRLLGKSNVTTIPWQYSRCLFSGTGSIQAIL
jgi:hypothetical protein